MFLKIIFLLYYHVFKTFHLLKPDILFTCCIAVECRCVFRQVTFVQVIYGADELATIWAHFWQLPHVFGCLMIDKSFSKLECVTTLITLLKSKGCLCLLQHQSQISVGMSQPPIIWIHRTLWGGSTVINFFGNGFFIIWLVRFFSPFFHPVSALLILALPPKF